MSNHILVELFGGPKHGELVPVEDTRHVISVIMEPDSSVVIPDLAETPSNSRVSGTYRRVSYYTQRPPAFEWEGWMVR